MQSDDNDSLRLVVTKLSKDLEDTRETLIAQIKRIWKLEQDIKILQYQKPVSPISKPVFEKSEEKTVMDNPIVPTVPKIKEPIINREFLQETLSLTSVNMTPTATSSFSMVSSKVEKQPPPTKESFDKNSQSYALDLEAEIGGNWLSKIGILTLFLGLAFFFQYAFQHHWINEIMRVCIGILTGLVLLSLGEYFWNKNKYIPYARVMTGGGIAFLYLSFYAAYGLYHLIGIYPALGLMFFTTLIAVFFSLRYKEEINAIIGVIGAFLTPILLQTRGTDIYLYLFYSFILLAGILFLSHLKKWRYILVLGILGGYLLPVYLIYPIQGYLIPILVYYLLITAGIYWTTYSNQWEEISYLGIIGGYLVPPILISDPSNMNPPIFILTFYFIMTAGILLFTHLRKWQIFTWIGIFLSYVVPAFLLQEQTHDYLWILSYYFLTTLGILWVAYLQEWVELSVISAAAGYLVPLFLLLNTHVVNLHILLYYSLLTLVVYYISWKKEWFILSQVATIGGFLGPLCLQPTYNYQSELFPYVLILAILSIGLGFLRGWQSLIFVSYLFSTISIFCWGAEFYKEPLLGITQLWLVVFFLLFNLGLSLNSWIKKVKFTEWDILCQLLIATSYFSPTYWMLKPQYPYTPGYIAIVLIFYYLLNSLVTIKAHRDDILLFWNQIGLASVFAVLAIPILLDQQWITLGWSIEAVILTWIGIKGKNVYLRAGGLVLLASVVVRLFFYDTIDIYYPQKDFMLIFNRRFLAFLSAILSSYGILYLIQTNKETVEKSESTVISLGLATLANLITLWLFSTEILNFLDAKFGSWDLNPEKSNKLWMMKQMSLSCVWAVYSFILVGIGMWKKQAFPRIFAITLIGITILKVFLFDLSTLTGIQRILSFIVLGLILLSVSYMYQRFQENLKAFLTQSIDSNPKSI